MGKKKLNRIAEILEEKDISQYRLAKMTGISNSLINSYCNNRRDPGIESLQKIAKALKVKGGDLLTF